MDLGQARLLRQPATAHVLPADPMYMPPTSRESEYANAVVVSGPLMYNSGPFLTSRLKKHG